jgi:hypothetical protein
VVQAAAISLRRALRRSSGRSLVRSRQECHDDARPHTALESRRRPPHVPGPAMVTEGCTQRRRATPGRAAHVRAAQGRCCPMCLCDTKLFCGISVEGWKSRGLTKESKQGERTKAQNMHSPFDEDRVDENACLQACTKHLLAPQSVPL